MVYGAALEKRCPARDRGFESHPLRHVLKLILKKLPPKTVVTNWKKPVHKILELLPLTDVLNYSNAGLRELDLPPSVVPMFKL